MMKLPENFDEKKEVLDILNHPSVLSTVSKTLGDELYLAIHNLPESMIHTLPPKIAKVFDTQAVSKYQLESFGCNFASNVVVFHEESNTIYLGAELFQKMAVDIDFIGKDQFPGLASSKIEPSKFR
jgi:hypothetical protein